MLARLQQISTLPTDTETISFVHNRHRVVYVAFLLHAQFSAHSACYFECELRSSVSTLFRLTSTLYPTAPRLAAPSMKSLSCWLGPWGSKYSSESLPNNTLRIILTVSEKYIVLQATNYERICVKREIKFSLFQCYGCYTELNNFYRNLTIAFEWGRLIWPTGSCHLEK